MRHILGIILCGLVFRTASLYAQQFKLMEDEIALPGPQVKGKISVEQAINERRSQRKFSTQGLTLEHIGQLLWSAQGITEKEKGFRAAPSAGALYPMEIYLLNKDGLFHYLPQAHKLEQLSEKDLRLDLARVSLGQRAVAQAPVDIVIAAVYERVTSFYGLRGKRYTDIEVGHIAQNIHLQAQTLGLGSVAVGAFDDEAVKGLLNLPEKEQPLYIIPVGYTRREK